MQESDARQKAYGKVARSGELQVTTTPNEDFTAGYLPQNPNAGIPSPFNNVGGYGISCVLASLGAERATCTVVRHEPTIKVP